MDDWEIRWALLEAARENMVAILDEEMRLESLLSDLPEPEIILKMVRDRVGSADGAPLPGDISSEEIADLVKSVKLSLGDAVSEAFKDVMKQPKRLKAIRRLFSSHPENFDSLEPEMSARYANVMLDFAEKYVETPNWVKTQSLIIIADSLVNNVTGAERSMLDARLEANWGIYLWKCGDYEEAERKFQYANDSVTGMLSKMAPESASDGIELHSRILMGFGLLYGDLLEDKNKSIGFNKACLARLSQLEDSYRRRKMRTSILNNLGVAYQNMAAQFPGEREKHLTEAALHYEEALSIARGIHFTRMVGWILFNAGEKYAFLGEIEKAERYSAESRRIFSVNVPSDRGLSGVEMLDAVIAKEKKDYPRALESITRSIILRERAKEPRRIADALDLRGDIHLASGNAQAASVNYKDAHAIYKSIGSEAGVRKLLDKLNKSE